jgi:RNA polymerase-associated protein
MVQNARSRTVLAMYSATDDIQCHRVRLVLAAKGVTYDLIQVDPAKPPQDLIDLNPYGSLPTLVDRDLTLYDTSVICEYLDEPADTARKHLREHLLGALPLFKASKFFLNPEMSLADCLVAPVIWRLPALGVELGREGKPIMDYGERLFHSQGYTRSLTADERALRAL